MLLAAWGPGRWWRILVGYVALLPLQTFSVVSQVLMQLCLAARLDLNVLGIQTWQLEAIVYAYQMGGLMVPTLCPVLLWLALDMGFVRRVLLPAWNPAPRPAPRPPPMGGPNPPARAQPDGAPTP